MAGAASQVRIERTDLNEQDARRLIAALDAELLLRYPPEANHFDLSDDEVSPGNGVFLIARLRGIPVGCGALRVLDDTRAEIKRMYVSPQMRGERLGTRILRELELEALRLGVGRLVLETGAAQPEAIALYGREGFVPIPCFGEYADTPESLCLQKELATNHSGG
ncbi:MAG: GNAT family N-acetyltransferase [Nitriliruptorales bacterium]|nr:GNAT family N-acetyltransferase [Nitriliruptorales bacterium]